MTLIVNKHIQNWSTFPTYTEYINIKQTVWKVTLNVLRHLITFSLNWKNQQLVFPRRKTTVGQSKWLYGFFGGTKPKFSCVKSMNIKTALKLIQDVTSFWEIKMSIKTRRKQDFGCIKLKENVNQVIYGYFCELFTW